LEKQSTRCTRVVSLRRLGADTIIGNRFFNC